MTNEMKLIMALCDALGFKVETTADRKERKEPAAIAMRYNRGDSRVDRGLVATNGKLEIDIDGMYTSYLYEPEISYSIKKIEQH